MKGFRPTLVEVNQTTGPLSELLKLHEQIRVRAYELYEQRGREDGHELDDWLRAEAEVIHTIAGRFAA